MRRNGRRIIQVAVMIPAAMMLLVATAFALEQTNGTGGTNAGNTIGFNTKCTTALDVDNKCPKGDASGELEFVVQSPNTYTDPVYGDLEMLHCSTINSYRLEFTAHDFPRTRVTATCDGTFSNAEGSVTVYIKVYFVDKGEPGTTDRINFYATTNPAYRHNAELDPNRLVKDIGVISNGNVQIHTDVNPWDTTEMMVPVTT